MTPYFFRGPFLSRDEVYYVRIRRLLARIPKVGIHFKEQRHSFILGRGGPQGEVDLVPRSLKIFNPNIDMYSINMDFD